MWIDLAASVIFSKRVYMKELHLQNRA